MQSPPVLLVGEPSLREASVRVEDVKGEKFLQERKSLQLALDTFRKENGFGR